MDGKNLGELMPGTGALPDDSVLNEVKGKLDAAQKAQRQLKRKLAQAEAQVQALAHQNQQILSSTSWRVTSPLRKLRVLMGAPEPVGNESPAAAAASVTDDAAPLDHLVPTPLPKGMRGDTLERALKRNETCVLVKPEVLLEGLVPELPAEVPDAEREPGIDDGPPVGGGQAIAFVGSEHLASDLAHDVEVIPLDEDLWEQQLGRREFSFLLIEPVWHVGGRQWRNSLTQHARERSQLPALTASARQRGLPVVVWFRHDVDELEHFAWLEEYADALYAIDERLAEKLAQVSGRTVGVLAPAIQPAVHNPFRTWPQVEQPEWRRHVMFDGWLDLAEGAATDPLILELKDDVLLVAESSWEFGGVRLNDHAEFMKNALGCVTPTGKAALARMVGAEVFRASPLMPDWKRETMMLRAIASGALVAHSGDHPARWGALPLAGAPGEVAARLRRLGEDPLLRARTQHEALRQVLHEHCISDRLNRIAGDLGIEARFGPAPARIACLLVTMRPDLLGKCLERFRADLYPHKELVVVLHGRDASLAEARALVREGEPISIYQLGRELPLGSCLNFAAAQTDAEYWAKIDDDDLYGPRYLTDIMSWRRAVDFPVGGKTAAFVYAEAEREIRFDPAYAVGRSWQYRRAGRGERIHIAGGTLVGKKKVLEEVSFSDVRRKGSDTDFLRRADEAGFDFFGFDFFNFALFRSGVEGFHTWNANLEEMKQRTLRVGSESDIEKVVFL